MAKLTTRLMTMLTGTLVGSDEDGNAYYKAKGRKWTGPGGPAERRWVLYKGEVEASRVPPLWHAWLHYIVDEAPLTPPDGYPWQAAHQPNLTGTQDAYRPAGSSAKGGQRQKTTSDYEPWIPN